MAEVLTVVLASSNPGKLAELRALLEGLPIQILSAKDALGASIDVSEDGANLEENAILKARAVARATRMVSLSDDSGLEVEALGGRPGVRSARFAHERATDAENNAALLRELEEVGGEDRSARFRCVLAVVTPWSDSVRTSEGICEGSIARAARGGGGFGYDPLFVVDAMAFRVMAELSDLEKNQISHRGQAVRALRPILLEIINQQLERAERVLG
jgi:XTP/dITP diphosphohydrolase